jgi:hypothetical protein
MAYNFLRGDRDQPFLLPVGARRSVVAAELRVRQRRCRAAMIGIWLCDCSICCSAR